MMRRTATPRGMEKTRSVACPRRGSATLDTCQSCSHLNTVTLSDAGSSVVCSPGGLLPKVAAQTAVSAIMTTHVLCVRRDIGIEALMAIFLDPGVRAVPVVDADGVPVGLIERSDRLRRASPGAVVADVMAPLSHTIGCNQPISAAAALMTAHHLDHLPVVGADGRLAGMLSRHDFARRRSPAKTPAGRRILVIDAGPASRMALGELLRDEGYQICMAPSTAEALRDDFAADVIIADMDGRAVDTDELRRLAERVTPAAPVIWMAQARPSRSFAAPVVMKPIDLSELLLAIERT
jgi:CBS domain-containing protein